MFDTDTIKRIEDELQVVLPQAYRELLLSYPFANDPDPYSWEMFGHVEAIIGENKACRAGGFFGAEWPSQYLVIGEDGFGDLYFLDFSRRDEAVFFADHEATSDEGNLAVYLETPTLAEWIRQMKEERVKADAEEARAREARAREARARSES